MNKSQMLNVGRRSNWVVLGIAVVALWALFQAGQDSLLRVALWAAIVAASVVGLPEGLRRWLLGESRRG